MDSSAPKRRKTSPRTSFPVQPDETAPGSTTPQDPLPQPAEAAKQRPSFASPTKASLERHNPDILRRRESPPKQPRAESIGNTSLSASRPASRGSNGNLASENGTDPQRGRMGGARATSLAAGDDSVLRSPARRPGAKRAPVKANPRPLPPPEADEDEEILNPFARRGLRRSPTGDLPEPPVVPEPELPPTPERPDPVVSTPPSGIHNTPSRRPRRSKALAERLKSSSPLKNPPMRSSVSPQDGPPLFKLPPKANKASKPSRLRESDSSQEPTTAELRGLQPADPDAEKKKLRESLLAEIAELEHDLAVASRENERIHEAHLSKTSPARPVNGDEILNILRRHTLPPSDDDDEAETSSTSWLHSALNPIAFLPFSKPLSTFQPPSPKPAPPISHHPTPMTAEDALPYLQVFTPLTFTSTITPVTDPSNPSILLQKHAITATSTAPRGLFAARLEMTVNTRTMAVVELAVPKLDPAAAGELIPFVDRVVSKTSGSSSGVTNNVGVLTWAMGEWLRVATQRARVWCVLEREVQEKEALRGLVGRMRSQRKRRRRRAGRDEEEEESEDEEALEDGAKYGAAELLPFMGRTSMDFEVPFLGGEESSTLRVQWRVRFDWTGEGRSGIGVLVGVPGKWHKCDERGRLSGIPKLFDELIQGGAEPLTAVRTVVSLLAGEQRS
ncbi:hypothetical protein B0H67DRAFT_602941 [Lasiosphaeris hirsuta]|uniref:Uncharacterized protein n=1 Tax=Lasiosphaeris hirsuta TaxID=260670 RepID=A0AA40A1T1_9PEZI|nr:hypothetical protein B0H67DRAFT_602941 [Lasiosphaeris hirsuta]